MELLEEKLNEAFVLFDQGRLNEAELLYNECLNVVEDRNAEEYAQILHGLGYVKAAQRNYDVAREHYSELLDIAITNGQEMDHCVAVHQLGMVERMASCYEKAEQMFQLEAKLLKEYGIASTVNWSANYYEQGYVALMQKKLELAEKFMKESLNFAKESADDVCLGCAYRGLGEFYIANNHETLAKEFFQYSLDAFERANDVMAIQEIKELL